MTAVSRPHDGPGGAPPWLLASVNPNGWGPEDTIWSWRRCSTRARWTARYGRNAIRIDANRPGLYRWVITLEGHSIRKGTAPGRDEAADAVSQALEELPHQGNNIAIS